MYYYSIIIQLLFNYLFLTIMPLDTLFVNYYF